MKHEEFKQRLMQNPEFKKEWERFDLWFEIQQLWLETKCRFFAVIESIKAKL
jgi:hypothetical protein